MRDRQGKWRVKCGFKGCDCDEYLVEDVKKIRCDYCTHSPADHCWLGACEECKSDGEIEAGCDKYEEDEEDNESGVCSYCEHKKEKHKLMKSNVTRVKTTPPQTGLATAQSIQKGLPQCKLQGCTKPCFMELNGHVHDYCCRTHAKQASSVLTTVPDPGSSATQRPPSPPRNTRTIIPSVNLSQNPSQSQPQRVQASQVSSTTPKKICKRPGCGRPCFMEKDGHVHDYCGRTCANKGIQIPNENYMIELT